MSRVHDALRKAEELTGSDRGSLEDYASFRLSSLDAVPSAMEYEQRSAIVTPSVSPDVLARVGEVAFNPAEEAHLISLESPQEVPGEEFRSLRTRLNHLQTQQKLNTVVVTSASPAEGKTFTAVNLALAQSQLTQNPVLMADLDLRRPALHRMLRLERGLGFSDYVLGNAPLDQCLRRVSGTSLYIMTAGTSVKNPLELLSTPEAKSLIEEVLPRLFKWSILDSPPLLFSADANLLSTLADGTVIVVRIGATTYDNILRAMQSLCENNVLGIVVNGARAGELYSKFTYYYSKPD